LFSQLHILELGVPKTEAFRQSATVPLEAGDFPVAMIPDNKFGSFFVLTRLGYVMVFEIQSAKLLLNVKACQATCFTSVEYDGDKSGVVAVDQKGRLSHFFLQDTQLVPYICQVLGDMEFGVAMARRYNLPGAEPIFRTRFQQLMQSGQLDEAIQLAASSPGGCLRNMDTINQLKQQAGPHAIKYFQLLLQQGRLNAVESVELARPMLAKSPANSLDHIREWLKEAKLESSEELGDLLKQYDVSVAVSVYLRAKCSAKVIGCFLSLASSEPNDDKANEHLAKIPEFAKRAEFSPDYPVLVQQLMRVNRDRAKDLALILLRHPDGPKLDITATADLFIVQADAKNATAVLLDYLRGRGDRPEDAGLQTRLFEINLLQAPQVANVLFESEEYRFTHFDRIKVAQLCERAQLYQRALELYTDLADIKRVLVNSAMLDPNFLLEFFGRLQPASSALECLHDMLKYNLAQNIRLVVEVAKKWSDYLTPEALISMFEEFKSHQGLFFYLGSFVNFSDNKTVVFKYIEAATKLQQMKEVERVCRDHEHYEAKEVKQFLIDQHLKDPRALIYVCDRFGYIEELTHYLYNNNMQQFIDAYVQRMNSKAAPEVVGALLDLNATDDQIKKLIETVRPPPDDPTFVERLVEQVERRNRLKLLRPWLEVRLGEGNEDVQLHNGLAKVYIDTGANPANFLNTNKFYDSKVVGLYCESRDPHLAVIAYKRARGACDDEFVNVTNKNGFFKDQARYLVERQDLDLWAKVLIVENQYRRQLIDQVVATALPECKTPEEVSTTVKAFMAANLPLELIELLERIILHGPQDGEFAVNKNLQNLLILTAIKADKKRVMDYIKRLENYDGPDIAKIAVSEQYQLYEEAFFIYKKFKKGPEAIQVLLENLTSIERATEFADAWNQPEVWSLLAKAQLDANMVKESIASFLKADDSTHYIDVIHAAKHEEFYEDLIQFLRAARKKIKEPLVDNELVYCFAKIHKLADMEEFISQPNNAKLNDCAEQCFSEELYEAAKILFNHTNNNSRLAVTYVKLKAYSEAVDAARKANSIPTWKQVCFACVDAEQFRLAQMAALHIIVYNEHLNDLIAHYEQHGFFNEIIAVLEQGINLDRAHQGIYTQLGILYCKYKEEKLMEHVKLFWSRLNIPTLIGACSQNQHWPEAVFLYSHYDQHETAVEVLMQHSTQCWRHDLFKETISHVSNTEVYYRAIDFYLREHPLLLNDLLMDMVNHLDHARVVHKLRMASHLPLVQKYLAHVQHENIVAVNEAINELHVIDENYKALRDSIDQFDQFDQIALAQQLEKHELLEFRRISAYLFKLNKRFERSIEISKRDGLWGDAMETVAESKDRALAEKLLHTFVERNERECFAAMLYTCYELIRPDVVLEVAWRFNLMSFAMPYMVQSLRDYDDRLAALESRFESKNQEAAKEAAEKKATEEGNVMLAPGFNPMMPQMLALPAPGGMPNMLAPPSHYPGQPMPFPPGAGMFPM